MTQSASRLHSAQQAAHPAIWAIFASALALCSSACSLPDGTPVGLELTWTLIESLPGTPRERTCAGANVEQVRVSVTDMDTPSRSATELFDCEEGRSEPSEVQVRAPEIFLELHPGPYAVSMQALGRRADGDWQEGEVSQAMRMVGDDQPTLASLDLGLDLRRLTLSLRGTPNCSNARFWLYYADATTSVVRLDGDNDPLNVLYRSPLSPSPELEGRKPPTSEDEGPILDGTAIACSALVPADGESISLSYELDEGRYLLDFIVDDRPRCRVPVEVGRDGATRTYLSLDLAERPC